MSDSPEPAPNDVLTELLLELFNPFEFLLELDLSACLPVIAFFATLAVLGLMLYGLYQVAFDPNTVDIATRLDLLSIDPDKWFPRS